MKAIEKIAKENFENYKIINKKGSARRIELFDEDDDIPCDFLVVHEDEVVWSDDLKKTCRTLKIDKKRFLEIIKNN